MRRIQQIILGIICAALVAMAVPTSWAGELTEAEFHRLHEQLQPAPDEPWRTIPWKIALLDAQRTAVKEQKPIFIWAMDGHPLGCT
ncbi:MAG: hypothetical protein WD070_07505 [Pirellulaceae bacterium]